VCLWRGGGKKVTIDGGVFKPGEERGSIREKEWKEGIS
jgi:hypothetical protein